MKAEFFLLITATTALAMQSGFQLIGSLPAAIDRASEEGFHHCAQSMQQSWCPENVDNGARSILPFEIIKEIQSTGAFLEEAPFVHEIHVLAVDYPSPAYDRWKRFCLPNGIEPADCEKDDPRYSPVMYLDGGVPLNLQGPVILEVADLLSVYAPLRQVDFETGPRPALPAARIPLPPYGVKFHHATFGAHKVFERISNGDGCPVIGSLPRGCIICRVNVQYSNCALSLSIFKA
jgi:hypothetical protein